MNIEINYEKNLIINNRELNYKGIFRTDDLFRIINRALEDKGYQKREKKTEELVTETGRKTYIELRPFKEKTNYVFLMIKIKILLDNITETVEDNQKYLQGDVTIIFDSWILTDYQHRWGLKPFVYFMKGLIGKYLYKFPLEGSFPIELIADTNYIDRQLKHLFKSYRPQDHQIRKEEDVIKEMEKEIEE